MIDCLASNGQTSTSPLQRLLWSATAGVKIFYVFGFSFFVVENMRLSSGDGKRPPSGNYLLLFHCFNTFLLLKTQVYVQVMASALLLASGTTGLAALQSLSIAMGF